MECMMADPVDGAIDARWPHTGLGAYTYNLVAGLGKLGGGLKIRSIVCSCDSRRLAPFSDQIRIVNALSIRSESRFRFLYAG